MFFKMYFSTSDTRLTSSTSSKALPAPARRAPFSFRCRSSAARRGHGQAAACPTAPATHPLAPALLPKPPQEAEPAPAFIFERGGPVCEPRDDSYSWQGLIHVQTLRGEIRVSPNSEGSLCHVKPGSSPASPQLFCNKCSFGFTHRNTAKQAARSAT